MERQITGWLSPKAVGTLNITENGNYDVAGKANVNVDVKGEDVTVGMSGNVGLPIVPGKIIYELYPNLNATMEDVTNAIKNYSNVAEGYAKWQMYVIHNSDYTELYIMEWSFLDEEETIPAIIFIDAYTYEVTVLYCGMASPEIGVTTPGWQTQNLNDKGYFELPTEGFNTDTEIVPSEEAYAQLTGIFSANGPFPSEQKVLKGNYDGTPMNITENVNVDVSALLDEQKLPLAINVNIPIPEGYVKPEGTLKVTSNGTFDVTEKKNVNVEVPPTSGYSLKEAMLEFAKESGKSYYDSIDGDYLFAGFSGDVSKFMDNSIFEQLDSFEYMFYKAYPSVKMPDIIINNPDNNRIEGFFMGFCNYKGTLPNLLKWDKKGQIVFNRGFQEMSSGSTYANTYPTLEFPNCTELWIDYIFYANSSMTKAPDLPYNLVYTMDHAFCNCSSLNDLSNLAKYNINNVGRLYNCFKGCGKLVEVPPILSPKINSIYGMFDSCYELVTVGGLNLLSCNSNQDAFKYCYKLTNLTLYNIKRDISIASGTKYGHLITKESLIQIIGELIDTGSSKRLSMGSANTAKLADVYVKIISEEADENGNVKLPFEVCESTDEGAILITNYVTLKNWSLS